MVAVFSSFQFYIKTIIQKLKLSANSESDFIYQVHLYKEYVLVQVSEQQNDDMW